MNLRCTYFELGNLLKVINFITSIFSFGLYEGSKKTFNHCPFTLKALPSSSWIVIEPCDDVLTTIYGPFHLLRSFPSPNSLTLELNSSTLSSSLNSFCLILWSCHWFILYKAWHCGKPSPSILLARQFAFVSFCQLVLRPCSNSLLPCELYALAR